MSIAPEKSGPSPWLTWAGALALSIGGTLITTSFTAGGKSEALTYEVRRNDAQDTRLAALEGRSSNVDVTLERLRTELPYLREGVDDLRTMLRGGAPKR